MPIKHCFLVLHALIVTMAHLLRIGDYVNVAPSPRSSGGTGWITIVAEDGSAVVEYVLDKKISKDVLPSRIAFATLDNTSRSQSQDGAALPSLLSPSYGAARDYQRAIVAVGNPAKKPKRRSTTAVTDDLLRMPRDEAYQYLEKRLDKDAGWLRIAEGWTPPESESTRKPQLTTDEKNKVMFLRQYLNGNDYQKPTESLAHAWGVTDRTIRRFSEKGVNQQRKQRSDAGTSVLLNRVKQQQNLNTYQVYKKVQRRSISDNDGNVDRVSDNDLKRAFESLDDTERRPFEVIAARQQQRIPFLIGEI